MTNDENRRKRMDRGLHATSGRFSIVFGALALWIAIPALAQDPPLSPSARPDAGRGEAFARHSCSGCHVVGSSGFGTDAAPPFRTIAQNPKMDADRLRGFLVRPHPPMAPLPLSRLEIEDLIAYFQQLRAEP